MPVSFQSGRQYFLSRVVQTACGSDPPHPLTQSLLDYKDAVDVTSKDPCWKISMCCSYHFSHRANSLMTEGSCVGGTVLVFRSDSSPLLSQKWLPETFPSLSPLREILGKDDCSAVSCTLLWWWMWHLLFPKNWKSHLIATAFRRW